MLGEDRAVSTMIPVPAPALLQARVLEKKGGAIFLSFSQIPG